jgi:hypothetical protein
VSRLLAVGNRNLRVVAFHTFGQQSSIWTARKYARRLQNYLVLTQFALGPFLL